MTEDSVDDILSDPGSWAAGVDDGFVVPVAVIRGPRPEPERPYHVVQWDAPDGLRLPSIPAASARQAAESFLGKSLKALLPHPAWEDGQPPATAVPDVMLAIDHDDRRFVVLPASWSMDQAPTHGEIRAMFHEAEVAEFEEGWAYLVEMWPKMTGRDQP